jgi:Glycosyl hydrolase family 9
VPADATYVTYHCLPVGHYRPAHLSARFARVHFSLFFFSPPDAACAWCSYESKLAFFAEAHLKKMHGIKRTPRGLTFVSEWGSLRHAAGAASILAIYSRALKSNGRDAEASEIMQFAEHQVPPPCRRSLPPLPLRRSAASHRICSICLSLCISLSSASVSASPSPPFSPLHQYHPPHQSLHLYQSLPLSHFAQHQAFSSPAAPSARPSVRLQRGLQDALVWAHSLHLSFNALVAPVANALSQRGDCVAAYLFCGQSPDALRNALVLWPVALVLWPIARCCAQCEGCLQCGFDILESMLSDRRMLSVSDLRVCCPHTCPAIAWMSQQAGAHTMCMQMAYIMGASGHSYVVGFGCDAPKNPHHRNSALTMAESGDWNAFNNKAQNAYEITGALVGGPNLDDSWVDDRRDYRQNEVALDFNAAMLLGAVQTAR